MTILAIDTSSAWCSVALFFADQTYVIKHELVSNQSSQLVLPWIQDLMTKANLNWSNIDAIAVSQGPGAFTGVRLGVGIAQGIAFSTSKPLIPIASLDSIAAKQYYLNDPQWTMAGKAIIALDARMNEVFWASYQTFPNAPPKRLGEINLSAPEQIRMNDAHVLTGSAFIEYQSAIFSETNQTNQEFSAPIIQGSENSNALGVAFLAYQEWQGLADELKNKSLDLFAPELCQPLYVRDKVAQTTREREQAKLAKLVPQ